MMRAVVAQTRMEIKLMLRRGEALVVTLAIPLGVLVFFTMLDVLPYADGRPVNYLVPGVLSLAVISSAMVGLGIATGFERQQGVLKRFGATPLGRGGLLAAKVGSTVVMLVVQVVAILLTAWVVGWAPTPAVGQALGILLLGAVTFAGIGFAMAGLLRAEANLAMSNAIFLALLLVGGIIAPVQRLPVALRTAATLLPAAALSESVRTALQGLSPDVGNLANLAIWAVVSILVAVRTFRWDP